MTTVEEIIRDCRVALAAGARGRLRDLLDELDRELGLALARLPRRAR